MQRSDINFKDRGMISLNAGLAGIMLGAAGAVLAYAFSNQKNRRKFEKTVDDFKRKATGTFMDMRERSEELGEDMHEQIDKTKKAIERRTRQSVH